MNRGGLFQPVVCIFQFVSICIFQFVIFIVLINVVRHLASTIAIFAKVNGVIARVNKVQYPKNRRSEIPLAFTYRTRY